MPAPKQQLRLTAAIFERLLANVSNSNDSCFTATRTLLTWILGSVFFIQSGILGCVDHESEVDNLIIAIQQQPASLQPSANDSVLAEPIYPVHIEPYVYTASTLRSPFISESLQSNPATTPNEASEVTLDTSRVKEMMEQYELNQLIYRGMMVLPKGITVGLVERPDGLVVTVKVGDYIGRNHGRIVKVDTSQIELTEVISNGNAGYMARPAFLTSQR